MSSGQQIESSAAKMLEEQQGLFESEQRLKVQKEELQIKLDSIYQQRQAFERRKQQAKDGIAKVSQFLRENETKRTRANKKAADERKFREQKEVEIERMKELLRNLLAKKEQQNRTVQRLMKLQQYLESVIETTGDEFDELKDVLVRFDTLKSNETDLDKYCKSLQSKTDQKRTGNNLSQREKTNEILALTNTLVNLQATLESTKQRTQEKQDAWDRLAVAATSRSLMFVQVKMTTNNLFQIIRTELPYRILPTSDILVQVERIQQFICDWQDMVNYVYKEFGGAATQEEIQAKSKENHRRKASKKQQSGSSNNGQQHASDKSQSIAGSQSYYASSQLQQSSRQALSSAEPSRQSISESVASGSMSSER